MLDVQGVRISLLLYFSKNLLSLLRGVVPSLRSKAVYGIKYKNAIWVSELSLKVHKKDALIGIKRKSGMIRARVTSCEYFMGPSDQCRQFCTAFIVIVGSYCRARAIGSCSGCPTTNYHRLQLCIACPDASG